MGRKTILIDDYDGTELPDDNPVLRLSINNEAWDVYLSEDNHKAFMDAIHPFIKNAEKAGKYEVSVSRGKSRAKSDVDMSAVRAWAIENKKTFTDAQGKTKKVGDRGRIPQSIIDEYRETMG